MTEVFRGVGYLLPHPIDGRGQLRSVTLGLLLNSSTDRVMASPSGISSKTNSRCFELFLRVKGGKRLRPEHEQSRHARLRSIKRKQSIVHKARRAGFTVSYTSGSPDASVVFFDLVERFSRILVSFQEIPAPHSPCSSKYSAIRDFHAAADIID